MQSVHYTPFVPSAIGASSVFCGESAAEVAEAVLKNNKIRELLELNGLAGYRLHAVSLHPAEPDESGKNLPPAVRENAGFQRRLVIKWQALQSLPQERRREVNPIEERVIMLRHGVDHDPDASWVWALEGGKLVAQRVLA